MSEPEVFDEEELVAEDDAVIGRVFRVSVVGLLALAAIGGAAAWLLTRERVTAVPAGTAVEQPRAMEQGASAPPAAFRDITAESGIAFVHENGARGEKLLPETMGGGAAFFDWGADGDPDLVFVNSRAWPEAAGNGDAQATQALYENDGTGRFSDETARAGLDATFYGMGVAAADADCDGRTDLFFTAVGPNRYFGSEGDAAFVERDVGLAGEPDAWSTCAAFFDAERDGDLDLFVGNYVRWSREIDFAVDYRLTGLGRSYGPPINYQGAYSYLYRNDGQGRFSDVSEAAGMRVTNPATGKPAGKALGVLPLDADLDGDVDLLVANDTVQNFFLENAGDGTFRERGVEVGVAFDRNGRARGAMGIDASWYRNDGSLGFAIGNFANEMTSLFVRQESSTLFTDEAIVEGIGAPTRLRLKFGIFFFDYDLDGCLDLLTSNGHLEDEINKVQSSQQYEQVPQLFWNAGPHAGRAFVEVPPEALGDLAQPIVGRGAAYADVDGDGDLDVLLTQVGRAARLYRNDGATGNHWLRVRVRGSGCNTDALGALLELRHGGRFQRRCVMPTKSYLSQVELPVTFGLGADTAIESLRVTWPDGATREFRDLAVDRLHVLSLGD